MSSLDLVEVFLQYNLVGNQYEQTLEVSYTSTTNTSYAYLLSVSVKYYLLIEIEFFNVLFDNKSFSEPAIKCKQEVHEKLVEM